MKSRSRAEGRTLRPFKGLDGFEDLLLSLRIIHSTSAGEDTMQVGERHVISSSLLATSGYRIGLSAEAKEVARVAREASISSDDVDLVVFSRDTGGSPLSETVLIKRISLNELDAEVSLFKREQQKPRPMFNKTDGFDFQLVLILNKDLEPQPLRPHQKGTILASGSIGIQVRSPLGDLQPTKLTETVRKDEELDSSAWIYVKSEDEYIDATSLASVLNVYVDEEILRLTSFLPKDTRRMAEYLFTMPALVQVVYTASIELIKSDYDPALFQESGNAVLNFIFQKVRISEPDLTREQFIVNLKSEPEKITAAVLAAGDIRKKTTNAMKTIMGDIDDVSNS